MSDFAAGGEYRIGDMRMKRNAMYVLMGVIVCAAGTVAAAASFAHERRAALATDAWGGMRVDWTAVADWPVGDTPVAKSVRDWIEKRMRFYSREPFKGDVADWDAMTRFYGKQFLADNGQKDIEWHWRRCDMEGVSPPPKAPDVDPGVDVFLGADPRWFCRNSAIIAYEDEHIVSYRSGFYGFFVGNGTSAAYVKCATFRKPDGKILGWDAFVDTNAVFRLVRELAEAKFKEGADYAGVGVVPVPQTPLFTKESKVHPMNWLGESVPSFISGISMMMRLPTLTGNSTIWLKVSRAWVSRGLGRLRL